MDCSPGGTNRIEFVLVLNLSTSFMRIYPSNKGRRVAKLSAEALSAIIRNIIPSKQSFALQLPDYGSITVPKRLLMYPLSCLLCSTLQANRAPVAKSERSQVTPIG